MAVTPLPAAAALPAVASLRETTTLITLDGTLLHRDRITLRPAAIGTALDLTLGAGSTLWSARVDDVAVRPLERGGGTISVPLGFDTGRDAVVEVVSVQSTAIPKGRSELALSAPARRRARAGAPLAAAAARRRQLPVPLRRSAAGGGGRSVGDDEAPT